MNGRPNGRGRAWRMVHWTGEEVRRRVTVVLGSGCWEWQGTRNSFGYGLVSYIGKPSRRAHRVSWQVFRGPIPEGLLVLHRCDNPPCVNPDHLFLGTLTDNARDMMAKGRGRGQLTSADLRKLSDDDISEARRMRAGGSSLKDMARRFGISPSHMSRVVAGAMPKWGRKLTGEALATMMRLRSEGWTLVAIGAEVGIHSSQVSRAVRRLSQERIS